MNTAYFFIEVIGLFVVIFLLPRAIYRQVFNHNDYRERSKQKLPIARRPPTNPRLPITH